MPIDTLFENPHDSPLAMLLMQVFITLIVSKLLGKVLSFIGQPQVIGQILAGIIFGPSVLGLVHGWSEAIWPENTLDTFHLVAHLGLIFFMFFLGLELDTDQIKANSKITIPLACASIIIPVGIGCGVAIWFDDLNEDLEKSQTAFILFIASGFGFSAFPVLATLLNSMNLLNTPIGVQAISLAAIEDIVVWIVLASASAFSEGESTIQGVYTLLLTLAFIVIMVVMIRPIFSRIHRYYLSYEDDCNLYMIATCFLLLLVGSFTTEVLGVHAFFGAFIAGLCVPRAGKLIEFLSLRIGLLIIEFFLPLYFVNSGLQTHLDLLNTGQIWWKLCVLIVLASLAKILPVTITAKVFTRKSWYYCSSLGILMNTRGIVQLVVLNIGVELKVLSPKIFAMFVFMAIVLTFLTSPILHILYHRDSSHMNQSNSYIPLEETTNPEDLVEVTTRADEHGAISSRRMSNASTNIRPDSSRTTSDLESAQALLDNYVHSTNKRRFSEF